MNHKIFQRRIFLALTIPFIASCQTGGVTDPTVVSLGRCLPKNLMDDKDILVYLGPVRYEVGDLWMSSPTNKGNFDFQYSFSSLMSAAVPPDTSKNHIIYGVAANCRLSMSSTNALGINVSGIVPAGVPVTASAGINASNSKIKKITFDTLVVDTNRGLPDYSAAITNVPISHPARASASNGGMYYARAMIKVTNYSVIISTTSNAALNAGASLPTPTSLNVKIDASNKGDNELTFSVPGEAYIAAIFRPIDSNFRPQTASASGTVDENVYPKQTVDDKRAP